MIRYCTVEYRCGGISAVLHFSLPLICHNIPSMKNLLIVCLCLAASCSALRGFTDAECGVIASQQGHIMRLWTVADPGDSLFLRRKAVPLGARSCSPPISGCSRRGCWLRCATRPTGRGIAAPQVGVSRRLIAVQRFDKPGEPFCFYVNPEIVWYSQTRLPGSEGCLSIPGVSGSVLRSERIVVRYLDEESLRMAGRYGRRVHGRHFPARGRPSGRRAVHRQAAAAVVPAGCCPVYSGSPRLSPDIPVRFRYSSLALRLFPAVSGNLRLPSSSTHSLFCYPCIVPGSRAIFSRLSPAGHADGVAMAAPLAA